MKAGKGTMYSMKTYQRAFGVEWQRNEGDNASDGRVSSAHSASDLSKRPMPRPSRRTSRGSDWSRNEGESHRITNVRDQCVAQKKVKISP